MQCLSKDDLVLFYYGETSRERGEEIGNHLKECSRCFKLYEETKRFLSLLKRERKEMSSFEIESIIRTVRELIEESSNSRLRKRLGKVFECVFPRFTLRLRLVSVVAAIIICLLFFPVFINKKYNNTSALKNKWDILQIEMELSLDDEDASTFDVYYNFDGGGINSSKSNLPRVNFSHIS